MWGGGEADNDGELWPWGRRARRDKWGRGGEVEDGCACSSPHRATPTPRRSPPFPVAGGSKIYPGDIVTFSVTLTLHHRHAIPPACGQLQAHAPFFPHTKQARAEKRAQLPPRLADGPTPRDILPSRLFPRCLFDPAPYCSRDHRAPHRRATRIIAWTSHRRYSRCPSVTF